MNIPKRASLHHCMRASRVLSASAATHGTVRLQAKRRVQRNFIRCDKQSRHSSASLLSGPKVLRTKRTVRSATERKTGRFVAVPLEPKQVSVHCLVVEFEGPQKAR